jgi:hypothetical protein
MKRPGRKPWRIPRSPVSSLRDGLQSVYWYAVSRAPDLRPYSRFLDIAGGSGIYGAGSSRIRMRQPYSKTQDKAASTLIAQRGYADRVSVLSGDMFVDPCQAATISTSFRMSA